MIDKIELIPNKMVKKGDVIFWEGDAADGMHYICSGKVEISATRDGKTTVFATLHEGEIFGEMALVDAQPRSATVTAVENTWLYTFRANLVQEKLKNADPILAMMMKILASSIRNLNEKIAKLSAAEQKKGS